MEDFIPLNKEVDAVVKANSTYHPLNIKSGLFNIGDKGMEFRSDKGGGFIQVPWDFVKRIRVQMFFKGRYVRGIFIETTEDQEFEFILSDAKYALQNMRKHLPREKFAVNQSNFIEMFKRKKQKR